MEWIVIRAYVYSVYYQKLNVSEPRARLLEYHIQIRAWGGGPFLAHMPMSHILATRVLTYLICKPIPTIEPFLETRTSPSETKRIIWPIAIVLYEGNQFIGRGEVKDRFIYRMGGVPDLGPASDGDRTITE
jgi:hypothetical protein